MTREDFHALVEHMRATVPEDRSYQLMVWDPTSDGELPDTYFAATRSPDAVQVVQVLLRGALNVMAEARQLGPTETIQACLRILLIEAQQRLADEVLRG